MQQLFMAVAVISSYENSPPPTEQKEREKREKLKGMELRIIRFVQCLRGALTHLLCRI